MAETLEVRSRGGTSRSHAQCGTFEAVMVAQSPSADQKEKVKFQTVKKATGLNTATYQPALEKQYEALNRRNLSLSLSPLN